MVTKFSPKNKGRNKNTIILSFHLFLKSQKRQFEHWTLNIETTTSTNIIHHPWLWNVLLLLLLLPSIPFHGLPVALHQSSWARHAHGTWSKHRKRSTSSEEAVIFRTTLSSGTRLPLAKGTGLGPSPGVFMSWVRSGQDKTSESHVYLIIWTLVVCLLYPRTLH